ncbi:acyl carrier protein [Nonomuraea angiospora]|uniref:acyl carrier protein n=1 Tax=Nonomuraea angiospora TaxID=46172 RepID=UPI00344DFFF5
MTDETIFEELRHLCAAILHTDPTTITLETDLYADLEADSLDLTEVIVASEQHFGTVLDPVGAQPRTVAEAVRLVRTALDRSNAVPTA